MAVTLVSVPDPDKIWSFSYPIEATISSDQVGQPGIQSHRFYAIVSVNGRVEGTKYFASLDPPTATYDLSRMLRTYVVLDTKVNYKDTDGDYLTELPDMAERDDLGGWGYNSQLINVYVETGESYTDNGVYTTNGGPAYSYKGVRGKSSNYGLADDFEFKWATRIDQWGLEGDSYRNTWGFSAEEYNAFPVNIEKYRDSLVTSLKCVTSVYTDTGQTDITVFDIALASLSADDQIIYVSLYANALVYGLNLSRIRIRIYDGASEIDQYNIVPFQQVCPEDYPMITLMFQDRYNQWSYLSFPRNAFKRLNKTTQEGYYANEGRIRYSPEVRELWRLNTDLTDDTMHQAFEDLFNAVDVWAIANNISPPEYSNTSIMYRVVVRQDSISVKTQRVDKAYNYTFEIERSLDAFIP